MKTLTFFNFSYFFFILLSDLGHIKIGNNYDDTNPKTELTEESSATMAVEDTNSLSNWSDTNHSLNNFSEDCVSRNSLLPNSYFRRHSCRRYQKIYSLDI